MMDYLKDYNMNNEQIEKIASTLKDNNVNVDIFEFDPEKIISILDLFKEIGITNFYEIILANPSLFYDTLESIEIRLQNYENKEELARLINDDVNNLMLVDLL